MYKAAAILSCRSLLADKPALSTAFLGVPHTPAVAPGWCGSMVLGMVARRLRKVTTQPGASHWVELGSSLWDRRLDRRWQVTVLKVEFP